ncbi:hypothetical protein TI03_00190 [Achromatium sp. WMS1]|nr:hypothetical protein TI03_00190 [Achromatium sp. WMS1]
MSIDHYFAFEDALTELEFLVDALEHGDMPIDDALKLFDHGLSSAHKFSENLPEMTCQLSQADSYLNSSMVDIDD